MATGGEPPWLFRPGEPCRFGSCHGGKRCTYHVVVEVYRLMGERGWACVAEFGQLGSWPDAARARVVRVGQVAKVDTQVYVGDLTTSGGIVDSLWAPAPAAVVFAARWTSSDDHLVYMLQAVAGDRDFGLAAKAAAALGGLEAVGALVSERLPGF